MRLLDANAGIGRPPAKPTVAVTLDELRAELGRMGFVGGVVTAVASVLHEPTVGNRELARLLAGQRAWRQSWVLYPGTPGEAADPAAQVGEALSVGAAAVRIAPATLGYAVADIASGLRAAAAARLPLQIDLAELGWDGVSALCAAHPDLTVVVSRVSYRALRRLAPAFATHHTLLLDTVDFSTHEGWEWFVDTFGAERLLLATGTPTREAAEAPTRLQWSSLDDEAAAAIGWRNAVRVFGLDPPEPSVGRAIEATEPGDDLAAAVLDRRPWPHDLVDAHAHLGPYSLFMIPEDSADAMVRVMDRTGCRSAVVSANRAIQQDAWAGNADVARAVAQHPGRILGYGVVNPWQDPEQLVESIAADPAFVGIKLHPSLHEYPLTGERYRPVWEWASATGCPVLTHTWFTSPYDDPVIAGEVAERYPEVRLIFGHAGVSPAGNAVAAEVARRYPEVHLETCGSFQTGRLLTDLVERAGASKVLFGSDFCFIDQRVMLGRVTFSGLAPDTRAAVLAGNARRLFDWRQWPPVRKSSTRS